jgi:hypothetical protein
MTIIVTKRFGGEVEDLGHYKYSNSDASDSGTKDLFI